MSDLSYIELLGNEESARSVRRYAVCAGCPELASSMWYGSDAKQEEYTVMHEVCTIYALSYCVP